MAKDGDPIAFILIAAAALLIINKKSVAGAGGLPRTSNISQPSSSAWNTAIALPSTPRTGADAEIAFTQSALNDIFPSANLAVDGIMGPQTRSWVIEFQKMWGIPATGIVGPETSYGIRSALGQPGFIEQPYSGEFVYPEY